MIFLLIPIFSPKQLISDINKGYQIETNKPVWKKTNLGKTNESDIIWKKMKMIKKIFTSKEVKKYEVIKNNNEL